MTFFPTLPAAQTIGGPMSKTSVVTMHNASVGLSIDSFGGAITSFTLGDNPVNPLSFAFTDSQMPENNQGGAVYQGHFACIGRWGEASPAEQKMGIPNHGEPANILWEVEEASKVFAKMSVKAGKEGLYVNRVCRLDEQLPVFLMKETVTNTTLTGRPFNITQHPSLATPFLDSDTIISCNATTGFDQANYKNAEANNLQWQNHFLKTYDQQHRHHNAVFSFIVDETSEYGWVTAYSPTNKSMLGYVWKRSDYPWLHHWQHFNEDGIQFRGIEFGTAGIHQPFKEIIYTATHLFGEKTMEWIEPGEELEKSFYGFLLPVENVTDVKSVTVSNNAIIVTINDGEIITLNLSNNIINGLHK